MLKKLKEIFKYLGECIVDLFKEILGINSPSEEAMVTYTNDFREMMERIYEQRRLYEERIRDFSMSHNCIFKVGDKVKIKDDICRQVGLLGYLGTEMIVERIDEEWNFPRNMGMYHIRVRASVDGRIFAGYDVNFDPYQDYSNIISFIKSLK